MTQENLVPYTSIYRRYQDVKAMNHKARLEVAEQLAAAPEIVAREFAESIGAFSAGYRNDAPFFPAKRFPRARAP